MQRVEIEGPDGRWQRVAATSVEARLAVRRREMADLERQAARVGAQFEAVEKQIMGAKPMITEPLRTIDDVEAASLSGTLTKARCFEFIEAEAAKIATRDGIGRPAAITAYVEKNPKIYASYVNATDDAPAPSTASAPTAPRAMGSAERQLDLKARAFAASHGVTFASAMESVAEQNPALYKQHVAESRAR